MALLSCIAFHLPFALELPELLISPPSEYRCRQTSWVSFGPHLARLRGSLRAGGTPPPRHLRSAVTSHCLPPRSFPSGCAFATFAGLHSSAHPPRFPSRTQFQALTLLPLPHCPERSRGCRKLHYHPRCQSNARSSKKALIVHFKPPLGHLRDNSYPVCPELNVLSALQTWFSSRTRPLSKCQKKKNESKRTLSAPMPPALSFTHYEWLLESSYFAQEF